MAQDDLSNENSAFRIPHSAFARRVLVIAGPTAVGKTALSLALATALDGEIVSADSRQVYRHMDIGTAKPTPEERSCVPHHMLDRVDPDERYTAGQYARDTRACIDGIFSRGRVPVLVGGSGLYLRALLDGLFDEPPGSPEIEEALRKELEEKGSSSLHLELARVDAETARRIHPHDGQRLVRALSVFRRTGRPMSELWRASSVERLDADTVVFGLSRDRASLYRRIEDRVDRMIDLGLVEEVRSLLRMGYTRDLDALRMIGYREVCAFLAGEMTFEDAAARIKRDTRRYAKRQLTWFRRDPKIRWVDVDDVEAEQVVTRIVGEFRRQETGDRRDAR